MDKPLISICIPTYNRAVFLRECLDSITNQFVAAEVKDRVDVFILDNQSQDNTASVAREFCDRFDNIKYIKDDINRKIVPGIIKAATLADGEYIWIFSDDDLQTASALQKIIAFIKTYNAPEVIFCNLASFYKKDVISQPNLLKLESDVFLSSRHELFALLNRKFPTSIDYYTTLCSNWLLKKEVFDKNYFIYEEYNGPLDLFPLPSLVFYASEEFRSGAIARQIVLNRGDNESWGSKNKIKHFFYRDRLWRDYYQKTITQNKKYLPPYFIRRAHLKNLLRKNDLLKIIIILSLKKLRIYEKLRSIVKRCFQ